MITYTGRQRLAAHLAGLTGDLYIAVGTEYSSAPDKSLLVSLENEIARTKITSKSAVERTARLVGLFLEKEGVGTWKEIGLFEGEEKAVVLHNCDTDTDWISDNTLSVEVSGAQEGGGALESSAPDTAGAANVSFRNANLTPSYNNLSFQATDTLQFWYYVGDTTMLVGDQTVEIGSTVNDNEDEYQFLIDPVTLSDGWNLISRAVDTASIIGNPDLNNIVRFRLYGDKNIPVGQTLIERIDNVRLFANSGYMWARAELNPPVAKQMGEVRSVYWYIEFME